MELLIALFSLAALVWLLPVIRSGRLVVVAGLVLVVGTVFGPPFFALDGPVQFSLDRILWLGLLGLVVARWRTGELTFLPLSRFDWLVAALTGWTLLSALGGGPAPEDVVPEARWFFYLAMPASMYWIARVVEVRHSDLRVIIALLTALGSYLAVTAILEVAGLYQFVFPTFIADPEIWEFFGRGRGPLLNPVGNGMVMTMALTAVVVAWPGASRAGQLAYAALALVLAAGLYATLTRSVWLGAMAAVAVLAMLYTPRWVRTWGLAAAVLVAGTSALGVQGQWMAMKRDAHLSAADAAESVQLRPLLAIVAWEMFQDRPLAGHGYARYSVEAPPYHTDRSYGMPLEEARPYIQHNVFLSTLVDTGLIGLAALGAWLLSLAGIGWRLARRADRRCPETSLGLILLGTLAAYVSNGLFHDVSIIAMIHMFLFFTAGLAVTAHVRGTRSEPAAGGAAQADWRFLASRNLSWR